jgi:predicted transcriptional regulator
MSKIKKVDNLRQIIDEALDGRTYKWLCEKTGIHSTQMSYIVNGLKPSKNNLSKIVKVLKLDPSLLE